MNQSNVNIIDLPDEILLHILKKLNNLSVLYSLVGINKKLDRVVCDNDFTRLIDLISIEPYQMTDSRSNTIFDRFCIDILPRIFDKVECLILQASILPRVLHATNYPNLRKLVINNFKLRTNLKYLDLDVDNNSFFSQSLLTGLPLTICSSSSIVHLRIKMHNINDCLYLLDGRLSQLQTLIVNLDYVIDPQLIRRNSQKMIRRSLALMNKMVIPCQLKSFSLHVYTITNVFDSVILPFLHRMTYLEQLSLSIRFGGRNSFIDGSYLDNYLVSQLPNLQKFHFNIITENIRFDEFEPKPTSHDIRQTFVERGYHVDCYIDYDVFNFGRCHVYSLPFYMQRISHIRHNFPGGMFNNVGVLCMRDLDHPFEHKFFAMISTSFPLLRRLKISNNNKQEEQQQKHEDKSSIIHFSHLVELEYFRVHVDYVEQFLCESSTRLPCLNKICISYQQLAHVTKDFTRNTTRSNCAQLKYINFCRMALVHSKDYYCYFPSLL
ncbi:hypothetical protein I4U23_010614 [Adineta vaga]|nr:hypothetical protein I4U23_010614 [Adineta vaga]